MSWHKMDDETQALFDRLLEKYPGAVIAGGAVRDALLGYPITDIDMWIRIEDAGELELECDEGAAEYEVEDQVGRVCAVLKVEHHWCPYPIHIMLVEGDFRHQLSVYDAVDRFDYGLCKVGYDRWGDVVLTGDFIRDRDGHRLTLINERYTSPARYKKLKEKFEGWEVDAPRSVKGEWDGGPDL